jgi:hypothetical protein
MLARLRYLASDVRHWLSERRGPALGAVAAVLALGAAGVAGYLIADEGEAEGGSGGTEVLVGDVAGPEPPVELGFPAVATANTTRVPGADPIADAAAAAIAVFPSAGGVPGPSAVTLVDAADWAAGVAATSLMGDPIRAPVLLTDSGEVPDVTADAIDALRPAGAPETDDRQAFRVGDAAKPDGLSTLDVDGAGAAEVAVELARLRARLTGGKPQHLLLVGSDEPAFAMPAAAWAARSGDPVLFLERNAVPEVTLDLLKAYEGVPVYVLGPESAVSADALKQVREVAPDAQRVGAEDAVANAIAFARYADGTFGWNINDPGHGLVFANVERPLDAVAAAPLSASGSWGPLLISDDASTIPEPLAAYLLDLKPGFEDDPTRAVYNHAWLVGDTSALDVSFQARIDELIALAPIRSGSGADEFAPQSGPTEPEGGGGSGGGQGARNR